MCDRFTATFEFSDMQVRTPFVKAKSLLKVYPEELMDAHDVSAIVNSAKPECIRPVSDGEIPRGRQLSLL